MASPAGRFLLMATVPTGLERCAAEECSEVVGRGVVAHRGAITCTLDTVEDLAKVLRRFYAAPLSHFLFTP